jgi:hypothetical protein
MEQFIEDLAGNPGCLKLPTTEDFLMSIDGVITNNICRYPGSHVGFEIKLSSAFLIPLNPRTYLSRLRRRYPCLGMVVWILGGFLYELCRSWWIWRKRQFKQLSFDQICQRFAGHSVQLILLEGRGQLKCAQASTLKREREALLCELVHRISQLARRFRGTSDVVSFYYDRLLNAVQMKLFRGVRDKLSKADLSIIRIQSQFLKECYSDGFNSAVQRIMGRRFTHIRSLEQRWNIETRLEYVVPVSNPLRWTQ